MAATRRLDLLELPRFQRWAERNPHVEPSPVHWALMDSGLTGLIALSHWFWPEFVEVQGCVLLKENYSEAHFKHWWDAVDGDQRRIETVLNNLNFEDLHVMTHDGLPDALEYRVLDELSEVMAKTWQYCLHDSFPERSFNVSLDPGDDSRLPQLSFWSEN